MQEVMYILSCSRVIHVGLVIFSFIFGKIYSLS